MLHLRMAKTHRQQEILRWHSDTILPQERSSAMSTEKTATQSARTTRSQLATTAMRKEWHREPMGSITRQKINGILRWESTRLQKINIHTYGVQLKKELTTLTTILHMVRARSTSIQKMIFLASTSAQITSSSAFLPRCRL